MTTTINASTSSGLVNTADTSGIIKLQSNGVTTNALAWVNFDGTGTVAIRSSYNVSSITDNGTGDYTVNFTVATSDANYCAVTNGQQTGANLNNIVPSTKTTTSARFTTFNVDSPPAARDYSTVCVAVFGN